MIPFSMAARYRACGSFFAAARYRACAPPAGRIPGLKILGLLLLMPLMLSTTACALQYRIHPGALNVTDSVAYDSLLVAEAVIDQARLDDQKEALPAAAQAALNTLIQSYNVARESWLIYRGALANNVPPDEFIRQLAQNLSDLTNAIRALRERLRAQARQGAGSNEKEVKK
jgi:hypothetical protein